MTAYCRILGFIHLSLLHPTSTPPPLYKWTAQSINHPFPPYFLSHLLGFEQQRESGQLQFNPMNMVLLPLRKEKHFRLSERSKHHTVAVSWYCSPFHTFTDRSREISNVTTLLQSEHSLNSDCIFVWTAAGGIGENEDFIH